MLGLKKVKKAFEKIIICYEYTDLNMDSRLNMQLERNLVSVVLKPGLRISLSMRPT
jgi:hypothetical protein